MIVLLDFGIFYCNMTLFPLYLPIVSTTLCDIKIIVVTNIEKEIAPNNAPQKSNYYASGENHYLVSTADVTRQDMWKRNTRDGWSGRIHQALTILKNAQINWWQREGFTIDVITKRPIDTITQF